MNYGCYIQWLGDDHLILRGGGPGTFGRDRLFIYIKGSAGKFISG